MLPVKRGIVLVDDQRVSGLHNEHAVLIVIFQTHHSNGGTQSDPFLEFEDSDFETFFTKRISDFRKIMIGKKYLLFGRQKIDRLRMKVVRMSMGYPNIW